MAALGIGGHHRVPRRCRRPVLRRARRLLLLGRRHPRVHRRRHLLPALELRLPAAARATRRATSSASRPARAPRSRRHEQPARRAGRRHERRHASRSAATTPGSPTCSPSARRRTGPVTATPRSTAPRTTSTTRCPAAVDPLRRHPHQAPSAKVVVVGYPRVFMGEDCNAATWFSPEEETRLNQTADLLNGTLAAAAVRPRLRLRQPDRRFIGHAVCDDPEWLNGLSNPISESYHPNRAGQAPGYAAVVGPLLSEPAAPGRTGAMRRRTPAAVALLLLVAACRGGDARPGRRRREGRRHRRGAGRRARRRRPGRPAVHRDHRRQGHRRLRGGGRAGWATRLRSMLGDVKENGDTATADLCRGRGRSTADDWAYDSTVS